MVFPNQRIEDLAISSLERTIRVDEEDPLGIEIAEGGKAPSQVLEQSSPSSISQGRRAAQRKHQSLGTAEAVLLCRSPGYCRRPVGRLRLGIKGGIGWASRSVRMRPFYGVSGFGASGRGGIETD